jgi:hypothetical protein
MEYHLRSAFTHYLLSQPKEDAIRHVIQCLKSKKIDNQAWDMMASVNGENWSCGPEQLPDLIAFTLKILSIRYETESES